MKLTWLYIFSASAVLISFPGHAQTDNKTPQEIRLGSVAMEIPAVMYKRLAPLTKYLSDTLHRPVTLKLSSSMSAAINEVANENVEIAYLTPVAYIKARELGQVQLVAKTLTNKKDTFQLMVVVREDSPIHRIQDLEGKRFAFGDKAALLQRAVVVGAGMPLEKLGMYRFIGHYDNIAKGVRNGDFDAGILKDTTAHDWQGRGLRILYSSPPLPPYNIVASKSMDKNLLKQVRQAFLALNDQDPVHKKVIQTLDDEYDGFVAASDADYDVVRRLVAPFEDKK